MCSEIPKFLLRLGGDHMTSWRISCVLQSFPSAATRVIYLTWCKSTRHKWTIYIPQSKHTKGYKSTVQSNSTYQVNQFAWPKMIASSWLKFVGIFYDSSNVKSCGVSAAKLSALFQSKTNFALPYIYMISSPDPNPYPGRGSGDN